MYKGHANYNIAKKYVSEHKKKIYNTDDEIAVYQICHEGDVTIKNKKSRKI